MPAPEFEEKQYESAANCELARQMAHVFSAGQVAEAILGYDAAAFPPGDATIWKLLRVGAPPGVLLTPNFWNRAPAVPKAPNLPTSLVSLILQYKRAYHLERSNALQYSHRDRPYYRFWINSDQQSVLAVLEQALTDLAIVRYAGPAFHLADELYDFLEHQTILTNSNFVSPEQVRTHKAWTYVREEPVGYGNPDGEEIKSELIANQQFPEAFIVKIGKQLTLGS